MLEYERLKEMVAELGIGEERLRLEWISATEGEKFADMIKDTVEKIKKIIGGDYGVN